VPPLVALSIRGSFDPWRTMAIFIFGITAVGLLACVLPTRRSRG
jgi:hypothetical protein